MTKEHEFDVPLSAFEPKPWFGTRSEADAVLSEIREWIADGGEPHLWRGHTHSPPPTNASPVYIGEFSLPESRIKARRWAACPCCCPRDPKYGREPGKAAWFEDERVIRLMGPDCFRTLNPVGHDIAVANLEAEQRQWRDEIFLVGNLDKVSRAIEVLQDAREVAQCMDALHETLTSRLQLYVPRFWLHARSGTLSLHQAEREIFRGHDGEIHQREVVVQNRFGSVLVNLFDPTTSRLSGRFTTVIENLSGIDFPLPEAALKGFSERERGAAATTLARGFSSGRQLLASLEERRACLSPANLGTLRAWGRHPDSPIHFFISRDGTNLSVGTTATSVGRIELPTMIDNVLGRIPELTGIGQKPKAAGIAVRKSA